MAPDSRLWSSCHSKESSSVPSSWRLRSRSCEMAGADHLLAAPGSNVRSEPSSLHQDRCGHFITSSSLCKERSSVEKRFGNQLLSCVEPTSVDSSSSSPLDITQHQMLSTNVFQSNRHLELCRVNEHSDCLRCSSLPCKKSAKPKLHDNRQNILVLMLHVVIRLTLIFVEKSAFFTYLKGRCNTLKNLKILSIVFVSMKLSVFINQFTQYTLQILQLFRKVSAPTFWLVPSTHSTKYIAPRVASSTTVCKMIRNTSSPRSSEADDTPFAGTHTTMTGTHRPLTPSSLPSSVSPKSFVTSPPLSPSFCSSSSSPQPRHLSTRRPSSAASCRASSPTPSCRRKGATKGTCPRRWPWKWFLARWALWQNFVVLLFCLPNDVSCGQHERRLLGDLLGNYNPLERPVANESDPVQVSFGITLQQIIDVDEKNQLLVTNTWLKLEWKDANLAWNESDYGNVTDLRIPPYKIWKPDVLMYNSADEGFDGTYQTKVVVSNDGNCLYIPPGIFKSTCKIDITWFPFDDQKCKMKFGSWTYSGWQLDLQLQSEEGGDLSDFIKNGEWNLIGCPGKRNAIYYKCCPEPYVDVTFEIMIRRRTLYYFCNLILPCVLIASMAVLGFTLPPDCGEKLSLEITILLSLTLFLNMVSATTPDTSESVPLIGTYFNCIMFMVASSVVSTVLILNYHHRSADTHEMSPMVRSMFLQWLPWVLRMHRPGEKITRKTIMMNNKMKELELKCPASFQERSSKSLLANVLDIDDDFRAHTLPHPGHNTNNSTGPGGIIRIPHSGHSVDDSHLVHTCMSQCTRELNLILKEIRVITDKMRKDDEELEVTNEWRFAAMVVDRMCLIVFTLFTVTATVAVLLSAPHIMS